MLAKQADALPGIVLRVAGAFSDWCELPPLYSLIKRWSGRGPSSRLVPGRGSSGFPYIHRDDVVRSVIRCVECHATVVDRQPAIVNTAAHVDGRKTVSLLRGGTYQNGSCSGLSASACHGSEDWYDNR